MAFDPSGTNPAVRILSLSPGPRPPQMPSFIQLTSGSVEGQAKVALTAAALPRAADAAGPRGLYLHVPFCRHKCHYCDFYSVVDGQNRHRAFVSRLLDELATSSPRLTRPLETIFVGGGTPTLLETDLWQELLVALGRLELAEELEFTVEANPETVSDELLETLRAGGVNRLSIGAQSFDRSLLETLERQHDPDRVGEAVERARRAGFDNLNLDIIFGIPGETLERWQTDVETALAIGVEHLSAYGLMYEPNTPLTARWRAGDFERIDDEVEASMFEWTIDRLCDAGLEHYEISNWARPGRRCRHNLLYWHDHSWWPLGPAASGHLGGVRWKNTPRLSVYLASKGLGPIEDVECLDADGSIGEALMLRLRLIEGVPTVTLDAWLNATARGEQRREVIDEAVADELLVQTHESLRFTKAGLLLADSVLADLL